MIEAGRSSNQASLSKIERVKPIAPAILAIILLAAWPSRADLLEDVERLGKEWSALGKSRIFKPRLLERSEIRPLLLPAELTDPMTDSCTSIAVLGAPSSNFVLRFLPVEGAARWPQGEWPETSIAGAAQLVRCGARKAMLGRLAVEMRSPRAVFEIVTVQAKVPVPSLRRTLPHRDPGPAVPLSSYGPRPVSAPVDQRARAIEERTRREGAAERERRLVGAESDGTGALLVRFAPGCHRLDLLGMPPPANAPRGVDLDAELAWEPSGQVAVTDRTESADASLVLCVGQLAHGRLRFIGSMPGSPVVMLHARWDLPRGLRQTWDPEMTAKMAEAVWQSHNRALGDSVIHESLGIAGVTAVPIEVEPGACYLAAVAPIRGESSGLAMAVSLGAQHGQNHGGPEGAGTSLAFCSHSVESALVEVEARGVGLVWLLGVWQTGRVPVGEVQE